MVGEFFSGGACQKENGENCSAEAVMDGKKAKMKANFVSQVCVTGVEVGRQGRRVLSSSNPHVCACMPLKRFPCVCV